MLWASFGQAAAEGAAPLVPGDPAFVSSYVASGALDAEAP